MSIRAAAGMALGMMPTGPAVAARAGEVRLPVRVVQINVLDIGTPGSTSYNALGAFLTINDTDGGGPNSGLNPDIVCLEELEPTSTNFVSFRNQFFPGYLLFVFQGDGFNLQGILARPTFTLRDSDSISTPGPRDVGRVTLQMPGGTNLLTVYCAHFKAFGDPDSQNTRRAEANFMGNVVQDDLTLGLDLDDNGFRETAAGNTVFLGDLNSHNNGDGTLTGLFTHSSEGTPTGLINVLPFWGMPVESLAGRGIGGAPLLATFPPSSRLDYVLMDAELADPIDSNDNGAFSESELNAAGFVYYSGDDGGQRSNGNSGATSQASDHRPVVFDLLVPRDAVPGFDPRDIDENGVVDVRDLQLWETLRALGLAPDVDGDADADQADRDMIRSMARMHEASDVVSLAP